MPHGGGEAASNNLMSFIKPLLIPNLNKQRR